MKRIILLFSLMLSLTVLYAQQKIITGRVTDENSEAIPGVNVIVKGTTTGTTTDADGNFKITLPGVKSILQFTFIGFENQDVDVSKTTKVNLQLKQTAVRLDEVVAIGYATQKK